MRIVWNAESKVPWELDPDSVKKIVLSHGLKSVTQHFTYRFISKKIRG